MADDPALAQWRAQRMAQMQGGGMPGQSGPSAEQVEQQRKKQEVMQEQRRIMLKQILSNEAREKLSNIRLVKPERAEQVENYILSAAQSGQLPGKISEEQFKDLLRNVTEKEQSKNKVTIMRRRPLYDDDDDDDDDDF
ncbi:unnamed protein product [Chondrus crispus]|uniref:Programmed cell death protein 5 n=1 Tax=Chondrus crispus TaxID=2769 RepID=R7QHW4_CHOCR|nr:unnamed protein product [Chondrus crispus]CDF37046.1 unnamed protein product [Chondrus crispus]|eukprot:XP_005716865.1 unnamed protein product [Chondrus crispus]